MELRHYAVTSSPIDVELPESDTPVNLQQLMLEWHINKLGVQALTEPPQLLMLRPMRFTRQLHHIKKIVLPVTIPSTLRMPVFDGPH